MSGPRADLARALITADLNSAIVRTSAPEYVPSVAVGDVSPMAGVPTTVATGQPAVAKPKAKQVRSYTIAKGDTLGRVAQKYQCEIKELAKANGLKAPSYALKPGQPIKLAGCDR